MKRKEAQIIKEYGAENGVQVKVTDYEKGSEVLFKDVVTGDMGYAVKMIYKYRVLGVEFEKVKAA